MPSLDQPLADTAGRSEGRPSAPANNVGENRTIDDFLNELYLEYKLQLNRSTVSTTHSQSQNVFECIANFCLKIIQQLRHTNNCRRNEHSFYRYIPLPLLALCVANSSDATEILMLSYLLANPTFRQDMFANQDEEGAGYLASSIFLGMLIGGTILGFLSDSIGRKPALMIGLLTNATAGIMSSIPVLTPSFVELTFLRFIAGIGIGATVPPLFSLASEWSPKEIRGSVVTLVASFWMVGSLFVSGVAWCLFRVSDTTGSAPWRTFAASCALPSAAGAFMVYRYVPESPRFHAANHDYSLAARSCNQMAFTMEIPVAAATHSHVEMSPLRLLNAKELATSSKTSETAQDDDVILTTRHSKWAQSMRTLLDTLRKLYSRQLLSKTTLPLQFLWFSLSFGTYGITTWINSLFVAIHLQNLYFNSFLFALSSLPGNIVSILYSDKWGRKRMLVGSLVGAAGSLFGFAILLVYFGGNDEQDNTSWLRADTIVFFACTFQMFSIVSWNTIDIIR